MSDFLRTSQPLSNQYPHKTLSALSSNSSSSSTTTTSQPSPINDPSSIATSGDRLRLHLQSPFHYNSIQPATAALPSPAALEANLYFHSSHSQISDQMPQQEQQNTTSSQQAQLSHNGLQRSQTSVGTHQNAFSQTQHPSLAQGSHKQGDIPPPGFLAEAAKRAQMACLMRDLGDVTI